MKLTKQILSVILTVLLVCQIGAVAFAYYYDPPRLPFSIYDSPEIEDNDFIYRISEKEKIAQVKEIKNKDYTGKDLVIPKEIDGYKIVDIWSKFCYELCNENGYIDTVTSIIIEAELTDAISTDYYYSYDTSIAEGPVSDGLFEDFVNLKSIKLPDSLRIIHEGMFKNCKKLEHVELPESLEYIDMASFFGCESLKDVVFKDNLKSIDSCAFMNCRSLTKAVFNANLKELGGYVFSNCEKLTTVDSNDDLKIELGDNLETIGGDVFSGCTSLKGKIYLGEKVNNISSGAFLNCPGITGFRIAEGNEHFYQKSGVLYNKDQTKILCYLAGKETPKWTIPASVKEIDHYAFAGTKNLRKITMTSNIVKIPPYAFIGSGIESFSAPKNLKHIWESAFKNCENLKKVTFNSKLETIWSEAFSGCTKLEGKMEIGKNVKDIYLEAFKNCDSLTGFRIADGNKYFYQKSGVLYSKDKTRLISYLPGKKTEKFKIPSTVKEIDDYAFSGAKYLKEVTIPANLKTVPRYCFENSNISSVKFEASKKKLTIEKYAFLNCDKLKSITISERVNQMYEQAFYDCDNLTKIKVMNPDFYISLVYNGDDDEGIETDRLNKDLVIYGKKKAKIKNWADNINRPFKEI